MYSKSLRTSFFLFFAVISLAASAQEYSKNFYSPSTLYGIGQLAIPGFSNTRGMGDAGIGTRSRFLINHLNPAALTAQDSVSFIVDFGIEGNNIYASNNTTKSSFNGFSFDHVSVAFPISKRISTAITLQPSTQVGYRMTIDGTDPDVLTSIGNYTYEFNGKGGINNFQVGAGVKILEGLSLGANMNVYFGSIDRYYNKVFNSSNANFVSSYRTARMAISNVGFSTGLSYSRKLSDEKYVNLGLTYQPKLNLKATFTDLSTTNNTLDTNSYKSERRSFGIPAKYGVGFAFGKDFAYNLAVDYEYTQWTGVNPIDIFTTYTNTNAFRAGVEIIPNIRDFRNYFNRVTYRVGFRYTDMYYLLNGNKARDIAVTAGIGFPIHGFSYLNTSFEFGKRGTKLDGAIQDKYFTFTVGLSLFDRWFLKPMFN
jgi:hypothetical protein